MAIYEVETDKGTYEVETEEPIGKLESFGRGAANNVPLVPQAIAGLSEGDYSKNLEDWNTKAQAAKGQNPVSYGAGAVTGAIAPLAIPGVGAAMSKAPIAANALYGAASAISNTDLLKNPDEAVKRGVVGGLVGGATAGALGKLGPSAEGLEQISINQGVKSAGLRPGSVVRDTKFASIGKYMKDNDLVQGPLEDRIAKVTNLLDEHGQQIESAGAGTAPLDNVAQFTDPLHEKALKFSNFQNPELKGQGQTYLAGIRDIQQNGKTFAELQQLKTAYGNLAFDANHQVKNQAAADVWGQISDALESIASKNPEYKEAMTGYSHALDIKTGLEKQLGPERAVSQGTAGVGGHGLHSIIRQVPGVENPKIAIPGGIGLAAMGHPVLGAALGLHSLLSNPQVRSATAGGAAKMVGPAGAAMKFGTTDAVTTYLLKKMSSSPQSLGKYAQPLMQSAQTGGKQGIAATHYLLASQYPEYNSMMLKQEDTEDANR